MGVDGGDGGVFYRAGLTPLFRHLWFTDSGSLRRAAWSLPDQPNECVRGNWGNCEIGVREIGGNWGQVKLGSSPILWSPGSVAEQLETEISLEAIEEC